MMESALVAEDAVSSSGICNRTLLESAAQRAMDYLEALRERRVSPSEAAVEGLQAFRTAMPEHPVEPETVLELLDRAGSPATVASAGPRYFGFVIGGSLPVALAVNWLAGAWNQNAVMSVTSPVAAELEEVVSAWLLELMNLPPGSGTGFVSGGAMGIFVGLAAARHAVLLREGWDVESRGLFGAPPVMVVVSEESHAMVSRCLSMLGLGRDRVLRVPTDAQGRMRADALPRLTAPAIVCLQAGNVNTGAFDPVEEICESAHQAGAWVHVDGAFGLWALAAPQRRHLARGVEQADSWSFDFHKWLNVPYDSAVAVVRNPEHLRGALAASASYLMLNGRRDPCLYTPELSRRARAVEIWAALASLGRSGVAELVERCCRHAARFADGLRKAGYEVLNDVVLNQVLVSFGSDERTNRAIDAIQKDGTCWCSGTVWHGRAAMRISVSGWATTEEDVDRSLAAMVRLARQTH